MTPKVVPYDISSDVYYPGIQPTDISEEQITFNFKYLLRDHKKFCYEKQKCSYYKKLLERLIVISNETIKYLCIQIGGALRMHQINFEDTSESSFCISPRIKNEEASANAWQFSISSNKHGRVHGFLIGPVFYVVWLDPEHQLYPEKK